MKCMRHRTTYHRHEMTKKFSGIYKDSVNAESTLLNRTSTRARQAREAG
jgi:hypothetical protein